MLTLLFVDIVIFNIVIVDILTGNIVIVGMMGGGMNNQQQMMNQQLQQQQSLRQPMQQQQPQQQQMMMRVRSFIYCYNHYELPVQTFICVPNSLGHKFTVHTQCTLLYFRLC